MSSNLPDLLREKSNRLFFLKAILLGIQYGESPQRLTHKKTIQEEIEKLEGTSSPSIPPPPSLPSSNPILKKTEHSIQKIEEILNNLYQKRIQINSQIGNISANTYSKTLTFQQTQQNNVKINQLKIYLAITTKEIEKYTLLLQNIKKLKENPTVSPQIHNPKKQSIVSPPPQPSYTSSPPTNMNQNLQQQTISSFMSSQNEDESVHEDVSDHDFMKELQKTFSSLSSLLSNS